ATASAQILVNNTNGGINGSTSFILADLGQFGVGFSVLNRVGGAVIQTVDAGGLATSGEMIVNGDIAVRDNLLLASVDKVNDTGLPNTAASDSIYINANIRTDLVVAGIAADGVVSTVNIFSGDGVEINGNAFIQAEFRIEIQAGNNHMATMGAPGPYANDIDQLGRIFQTAGTGSIQTTDNSIGSGDIVLGAETSITITRLTARRLQAFNASRDITGQGNIDIQAQGDLE